MKTDFCYGEKQKRPQEDFMIIFKKQPKVVKSI